MVELDKWLDKRCSDGENLGVGEFTISSTDAMTKLAKFGLESREKGLLRLVQLAVAAGAEGVRFQFCTRTVKFEVEGLPHGAIDLSSLSEDLRASSNNFTLALLSCIHSGFDRGEVRHQRAAWSFDAESFQQKELEEAHPTFEVEFVVSKWAGFWKELRTRLRASCIDFYNIKEKLICCPIPVSMDGLDLEPDWIPKRAVCRLKLVGPAELKPISVPWSTPFVALARGRGSSFGREEAKLKFFAPKFKPAEEEDGSSVVLANLWVGSDMITDRNKIVFVRHGVIVDEMTPRLCFPVSGIVSAHGLDLNISGLGVVRNDKMRGLWEYLHSELEEQMQKLGLPSLKPPGGRNNRAWSPANTDGLTESATGPRGMAQWGNSAQVRSVRRRLR